jgi:hypothetical protein
MYAFMAFAVILQGKKMAMDIVFQRKKTELISSKRCGSSERSCKGKFAKK